MSVKKTLRNDLLQMLLLNIVIFQFPFIYLTNYRLNLIIVSGIKYTPENFVLLLESNCDLSYTKIDTTLYCR